MCKLFVDIQFDNFCRLAFLFINQIGVDLSCGNVFMGEHFADRVNFAAARHKQGCEYVGAENHETVPFLLPPLGSTQRTVENFMQMIVYI
jgi:hypothetical protein